MGRLQDLYINKVVNFLSHHGSMIARQAAMTHDTKVETGNQEDAYGWGVYYNKQLVNWGYANQAMIAVKPHRDKYGGKSYGKEWIFDFLANDFIPESNGFCLVVANAAPYSVSHELGDTPTGRKYRIISQVVNYVKGLQRGFKNSEIKTFNLGGGGKGTWKRGRPKGSKNRK